MMSRSLLVLPYFLALGGIVSDYATTAIGVGLGFYETHPYYHPVWALLIFCGAITLLMSTLPKRMPWTLAVNALAMAPFLGAMNNALVLSGLFLGLQI